MQVEAKKFVTYMLVGLITFAINVEGLLNLAFGGIEAGALNPVLAPMFLFCLLGICLFSTHIRMSLRDNEIRGLMILLVPLVILVLLAGVFGDSLAKAFRDIVYFGLIVALLVLVNAYIKNKLIESEKLINSIFYINAILMPLLSFFILGLDSGFGGRMAGFMLSPPVFANTLFLLSAMYLAIGKGWGWFRVLSLIVPVVFILLSGTRTALALFILFLFCYMWFSTPSSIVKVRLFSTVFLLLLLFLLLFGGSINDAIIDSGSRMASVDDLEGGSLGTRILWYMRLISALSEDFYVGGFGAGSSENLLGYITHFDFLRYWFDYSILSLVLLMWLFYRLSMLTIARPGFQLLFIVNILILTFLSTHNIFQGPATVMLAALYLYYSPKIITDQ